ncbi:MAG: sulfatase-like hydrolase/transferase [Bacteroidaceae bacterium]|nr:sulfatase-like hydrolase/transferase [Bacteroidaceae bacterium]
MEKYFIFIILHFVICLLYFLVIQRPLFFIYNHRSSPQKTTFKDWMAIYKYGYKTDIKGAGYLSILPTLIVWFYLHFPYFDCVQALLFCEILLAIIVGLLTVADTALYKFWQFKIDSSVFGYLKSLKGALASVTTTYILITFISILVVSIIYFLMIYPLLRLCTDTPTIENGWAYHCIVFLVCAILGTCVYLSTRGLKHHPENPSIAYFSKIPFYNHTALNPLFNLIYSSSVKENFGKQFQTFENRECEKMFKPLFPTKGITQTKLLNTDRPNILLIIWEGLCTHFVDSLGGIPNVAINFDRLSKEGVLFTQCYAGSFRTERGLVCLLSGYLGQPTTSIMRYTKKLTNLPAFPRVLRDKAGYNTTALHGGDLSIFHKSDYYLASGHDRLVQQRNLPSDAPACKWGIHDHYIFDWLYDDIQKKEGKNTPWYTTFQTLSSHEPFEVPYSRIKEDDIANSFAYTDHCFGSFIDKLKQTPAWDNLLVICTGDHGVNIDSLFANSEKSHIPMLLLGGAIKEPKQIDTIVGQTDLAATLLGQLGLSHEEFIFSRDVLADTYTYPFAFHTYNNGFIFRDSTGYVDFDNMANAAIRGGTNKEHEKLGKVILQTLYKDLSKR